jgi:hypothetical protein
MKRTSWKEGFHFMRSEIVMKPIRYFGGVLCFLFAAAIVAGKVNRILLYLCPTETTEVGFTWRWFVGIGLGLIAGVKAFQWAIRVPEEKPANQWFTWVLGIGAVGLLIFVSWYLYRYF